MTEFMCNYRLWCNIPISDCSKAFHNSIAHDDFIWNDTIRRKGECRLSKCIECEYRVISIPVLRKNIQQLKDQICKKFCVFLCIIRKQDLVDSNDTLPVL